MEAEAASLFALLIHISYEGSGEVGDERTYADGYVKHLLELVWLVRLSRQRSAMVEIAVTIDAEPAGGFRAEYLAGELFRVGEDLPNEVDVEVVGELDGLFSALHDGVI